MAAPRALDAAVTFVTALDHKDAAAAEGACTTAGWALEGDTPRKMFDQGVRKGFTLQLLPFQFARDGRAAVSAVITRPDMGRTVGDVWLLLVDQEGFWLVEGVTKSSVAAALFVRGVLPAQPRLTALPPSPDAELWARQACALITTGRAHLVRAEETRPGKLASADLQHLAKKESVRVEALSSAGHDDIGRAIVGLSFSAPSLERPEERWIVLVRDGAGGALVVHSSSPYPSLEAFLLGVSAPEVEQRGAPDGT